MTKTTSDPSTCEPTHHQNVDLDIWVRVHLDELVIVSWIAGVSFGGLDDNA